MHAGDDAGVVDVGVDAGRVGRRVGAGVKLRDHHRPAHVAFDDADQHLGAGVRRELRALVGAGRGIGDAHT